MLPLASPALVPFTTAHFVLAIDGLASVSFSKCTGLAGEVAVEEYQEGGENRFTHKLPVRTKYADLVLKRGMLTGSETVTWFLDAFRERLFRPKTVNITLMNEKGEPLRSWNVAHAVPKKWTCTSPGHLN